MLDEFNAFMQSLSSLSDNLLMLILYSYFLNLFNWIFLGSLLNIFGILPRKLFGLIGIFFYPLLHVDSKHFFSNALPFFVLSLLGLSLVSTTEFLSVVLLSHLMTSLGIWIFARRGLHVGASGLISSLYGWLITLTIYEPSFLNYIILFLLFIYFGSIIIGILPQQAEVSWEGHCIGLFAGIASYFLSQTVYFSLFEIKVLALEIKLAPYFNLL